MPRQSDVEERLMNAAMDLIWENSYGSTSVDAICAKAGAKKGSFYHFFESKSELAVKALEADWRRKKAKMDEIFSPSMPPLERLRGYFEHVYQGQTKAHGECGAVLGCPYCTWDARSEPAIGRSASRCERFSSATPNILNQPSGMPTPKI